MSNKRNLIGIIAVILIVGNAILILNITTRSSGGTDNSQPLTLSPTLDQSISDGTITMSYSSVDFGLAVRKDQIMAKSYIPPCDENFKYCFYYDGIRYENSNFESAGLRVSSREDLIDEKNCLNASPPGFDLGWKPDKTKAGVGYATSFFAKLDDAAAGHYSSGSLYRLYLKSNSLNDSATCYEFETRIGQSRYENYPAGSIKMFTASDAASLNQRLLTILNHLSVNSGAKVIFPQI